MNKRTRPTLPAVAARSACLALALIMSGCNGSDPQPSSAASALPDTPMGHQVGVHFGLMFAVGEGAAQRYEASLAELRRTPREATRVLYDLYQSALPSHTSLRWASVDTLATLESEEALDALRTIALAPLPPALKDPALMNRSDESLIRMAAVEGLFKLAVRGNSAADQALRQVAVESDLVSPRRRAISDYVAAGAHRAERVSELERLLPAEWHPIIERSITPIEQAMSTGRTPPASVVSPASPITGGPTHPL